MAVKIRLKRMGKIRAPFYRVVVMDSRTKRDGRAIEEIGKYHPTEEPSLIEIDMERANYWISQGAQPTEAVAALLKVINDGKLRTKEQGPSKKERYEAALAAAGKATDEKDASGAPRKKAAKKAPEKATEKAAEPAAEPTAEVEAPAEAPADAEKSES
ncbi:30S ribosomal protein S16 [Intrasporangium sp. DVR]|uniref:30S ribosomal protein S16 n=1 Tax=Intrasporangium sp. DVR TaxID=3127867 RepID=UPI00313A6678